MSIEKHVDLVRFVGEGAKESKVSEPLRWRGAQLVQDGWKTMERQGSDEEEHWMDVRRGKRRSGQVGVKVEVQDRICWEALMLDGKRADKLVKKRERREVRVVVKDSSRQAVK